MQFVKYLLFITLLSSLMSCENKTNTVEQNPEVTTIAEDTIPEYALVIHGGAGVITRENMTPESESQIIAALTQALIAGEMVLKAGGSSLDAIEATITTMEDAPYFNAGKGAVFTHDGKNELDASIMDGANRMAGAVGGVTTVKNPIRAARAVMEKSPHVFLTGPGADEFAASVGLEIVDPRYFFTQNRWEDLQRVLEKEKTTGDIGQPLDEFKFGTVGAAALDKNGNLAAGTSTGGMTNKRWGRVGDSPIIGAGTYANNQTCAVSCTGHGEFYIRYAVAHDVSALMEYKGLSLAEATDLVINKKLVAAGGDGGIIGVDRQGNVTMEFNTAGMYRGFVKSTGEKGIEIYEKK